MSRSLLALVLLACSAATAQVAPAPDRVLLKSGRWLRGSIERADTYDLEFSDDELGEVHVPRMNVRAVLPHGESDRIFGPEQKGADGDRAEPPGTYLDYRAPQDGEVGALRTATSRWYHAATDTTLFLVGVVHIGEPGYFRELQRILDSTDVVLFEGVHRGDQPVSAESLARFSFVLKIQLALKDVLGLRFQKDEVDYRRPFWARADIDLDSLEAELRKAGTGLPTDNPIVRALLQGVMSVVDPAKLSHRPGLAQQIRRQMAPVLAQADLLMQRPGFARLRKVIIEHRNAIVADAIDAELRAGPRGRWLSVFYGAGHMPDLQRRLAERGFVCQGHAFSDAWTIEPKRTARTAGKPAYDAIVDEVVNAHGDGLEVSVWLGDATGQELFERDADTWRAAASSIKTAYLVELFAEYSGHLDEPLPGADAVLSDPEHPAIAHFTPEVRAEIRDQMLGVSVRRVAQMMIQGVGVSNRVYNAAANVATTVLGGPAGLTARIRARHPTLPGAVVRRYMLADRNEHGDNQVTARSLATMLAALAAERVPGVDRRTIAGMRDLLFAGQDARLGRHYQKTGALDTDPMTRIRSGWFERDGESLVYVVMCEQRDPGARPRSEAAERLARTSAALTERLLEAARQAEPSGRGKR